METFRFVFSRWYWIVMVFIVSMAFGIMASNAHGQATLRYAQGPFTVTNGVVMRPFVCANNGTCPGTPTWAGDANVNTCLITITAAPLNYDMTGASPATGASPTTGSQYPIGAFFINTKPGAPNINLQRFRMIASSATNASVTLSCGW